MCPTLCDPMDYTVHGILQARILEWIPFPFSRGFSQPRNQTTSTALQVDSLPAKPQGKSRNTGVGGLSLLQWIFPTQELNQDLLHCRLILYQLSYQGRPDTDWRIINDCSMRKRYKLLWKNESCSVVSNSLQPHGLYSPWNSLGKNTRANNLLLLQGIFPTQESNQVSCITGRFFTSCPIREALLLWKACCYLSASTSVWTSESIDWVSLVSQRGRDTRTKLFFTSFILRCS